MPLDRPIFIIGTGRCGSTIFHEIFTRHPQVSFLTGLCRKYPRQPQYNRWAMHLMDVPLLRRVAQKKFRPAEHWPFWDEHCHIFSAPCRDLRDSDVAPLWRTRLQRVLEQMLTPRRSRLLMKLTGWPRTGFLSEIFPDAQFIHIVRDGRAVAHSLMNSHFWLGQQGPEHWRWGNLTKEQRALWERSGKSFWTLAGIQWNILMDSFEEARARLPSDRYLEIKYEEFAAAPQVLFRDVLAFCHLDRSREFDAAIDSYDIESANFKWRQELTAHQQHELETVMAERLARWGYSSSLAASPSAGDSRLPKAAAASDDSIPYPGPESVDFGNGSNSDLDHVVGSPA